MILKKTNATDKDFIALVKLLDEDLAVRDGDDHPFYDQFNKLDNIKYVLVGYADDKAVACGAIKKFDEECMEVKRMYTLTGYRGKGFAGILLNGLEAWAESLGFKKCILETGIRQPEAIALYNKMGYERIKNYGQYTGVDTSLCFQKNLPTH